MNKSVSNDALWEKLSEIEEKINKRVDYAVELAQVDMTAIDTVTKRLETMIEEIKEPSTIEHQHRHTIDIRSNWFFFSWVALTIAILGLFCAIANQRKTIDQYKENNQNTGISRCLDKQTKKVFTIWSSNSNTATASRYP